MSQVAICIDGTETVASFDAAIKRRGGKIIGQGIRRSDGMPLVFVDFPALTDLDAEIMKRRIESNYDTDRIAA